MHLTPTVHEAIEAAAAAVNNHLGRRFPAFADDIAQEARLAGIKAAERFRSGLGSPEAYFYRLMILGVAPQIHRWISVTSISRDVARRGLAGAAQRRAPIDDGSAWLPPDQEEPSRLRQASVEAAALRVRWRREVERATRTVDAEARTCGALALGLDGPRRDPQQIALDLGIWREDVEQALHRFRRRLKPPATKLERQVMAAEAVLP